MTPTITLSPISTSGSGMSSLISILIVGFFIIVAMKLINSFLKSPRKKSYSSNIIKNEIDYSHLVLFEEANGGYLLSKSELQFYNILVKALEDENVLIFTKVRLGDLVKADRNSNSWAYGHNEINRKHIDFVICNKSDSKVLLVLELDDASHNKEYRQKGDQIKNKALNEAGIPFLRHQVKLTYDVDEIKTTLTKFLDDHYPNVYQK